MQTQSQMIALLLAGSPVHYKKSGIFSYRLVETEEDVKTTLNGKEEVSNTAKPGDYILTGLAGEQYVVKAETFVKRYDIVDEKTAKAKRECWGIPYTGETQRFEAPASWNSPEGMLIEEGDMLVSPNKEITEAYRIQKDEFAKTYAEVKDTELV
jgi:hypothetical protein